MKDSNILIQAAKVSIIVTALLLLIPLAAKLSIEEMGWTLSDFVFAGVLIFGAIFSYKLIAARSNQFLYKAGVAMALGSGLFLIWSNLAVGIIGSEDNEANLMYFGIVLILILTTFISRFRAERMAYALFFTAFAQVLTIVIALLSGMQHDSGSSVYEIILVNGFFITLFCISGGLFWFASENGNGSINPSLKTRSE